MRVRCAVLGIGILLGLFGVAHAAPPEEAIIPLAEYKSDQAQHLATTYSAQLRQFYDNVYHCLPWLDIRKRGLGFRTPRGAQRDERYLSIWVWVEQEINSDFTSLSPARRASAMFSRYGVDLLRRLSLLPQLAAEPQLAGYSVVLSWQKPDPGTKPGAQPVAETLAVFADKTAVQGFFAREVSPAEFADRAVVAAFDGKSALDRPALEIWEDPFTATFKLKDYTPDPSHRC